MATILFVHAHPDDEASQTSGTMAKAVARGDRVVVLYATNGDHGTPAHDLGEATVPEYRRREAEASAQVIGTHRVEWLGYADSGMRGWPSNDAPDCLMLADLDQAALKVAALIDDEAADYVVGYDWHGGYGHPDHVMTHRLTKRAVELATHGAHYLEQTMNRDRMRALWREGGAQAGDEMADEAAGFDPDQPLDDGNPLGTPEAEITFAVNVLDVIDVKRRALACHASQTSDAAMMAAMPEDVFAAAFGYEYYIDPAAAPGMREAWPFGEA